VLGGGPGDERGLAEIGEEIGAKERSAAGVERGGFRGGGGIDLPLRQALAERRGEPAGGLCLAEKLPSLAGELVGEFFDIPGAAGRVGGPSQTKLLGEQRVHVAGDATRDLVGDATDFVE